MFSTPLALLGLLALPAIIAVHLFRRRFRPQTVSALFLWQTVGVDPAAGRRREPLRGSASLLLELLAALLIVLAMAGPRWGASGEPPHLVAIVDGTASMDAAGPSGNSASDDARAALSAAIRGLPDGARVTLIRTGPSPDVIAGPAAYKVDALGTLETWTSPHASHDPSAAFDLATELGRGGGAVYLTDLPGAASAASRAAGANAPAAITTVRTGERLSNMGFVSASRTRSSADAQELRLVIQSFADDAASCTVDIREEGSAEPMFTELLTLDPGETSARAFELPSGTGAVTCKLGGTHVDGLDVDDAVFLAPAPVRALRLATQLSDDNARALGLGSAHRASDRWASIIASASVADASAQGSTAPHLLLTDVAQDDTSQSVGAGTWTMRMGVLDSNDVATGESPQRIHVSSPFLVDRANALLEGVTLDGVVWTAGGAAGSTGAGLVFSGDLVLVAESEEANGRREWRFNIDPAQSTLGRSADWPIMLANAAESRRAALPGSVRTSLAIGESFHWRGAGEAAATDESWTLIQPDGSRETISTLPGGDIVTRPLDQPGFWSLERSDGTAVQIGVSLVSASESDLLGRSRTNVDPSTLTKQVAAAVASATERTHADSGVGDRPLSRWLAVAALLAMALDWWVLSTGQRAGTRTGAKNWSRTKRGTV